jgi:FkbM family methyltransferase
VGRGWLVTGRPRPFRDFQWRQAIKHLTRRAGVEVAQWRPPERRLAEFLGRNHIDAVLDVGANEGQFGELLRSAGFAGRIVSFEPLSQPFARLAAAAASDPLWDAYRYALGDQEGESLINVARNTSSSSFLPMSDKHRAALPDSAYVGQELVQIRRLDNVLGTLALDDEALMLKLDVQGYERAVLEGAGDTLGRIVAVQCELSVAPLYHGETALTDMLVMLRERGFELEELEPGFYDAETGQVLQFDGRCVTAR